MKPSEEGFSIEQARLLVARLERISADSTWAHRSSGLRGGLLRMVEYLETTRDEPIDPGQRRRSLEQLQQMIQQGFYMLEQAAQEKTRGYQ